MIYNGFILLLLGGIKLVIICSIGGILLFVGCSFCKIGHALMIEWPAARRDIARRQALIWERDGIRVQGLGINVKSSISNLTKKIIKVTIRLKLNEREIAYNEADVIKRFTLDPYQTSNVQYLCENYLVEYAYEGGKGRIDLSNLAH